MKQPDDFFFEKQLKGEPPLTHATAKTLVDAAVMVRDLEPWHVMREQQLIFVEDPGPDPLVALVIGSMAESFGVLAYFGHQGYSFLRRIQGSGRSTPAEFLAANRSLSVAFHWRSDMDQLDKDLLKGVGLRAERGKMAPEFRSSRPGYLPWFVNETEARQLTACLAAVARIMSGYAEEYWPREGSYPFFAADGSIRSFSPPDPVEPIPEAAQFDRSAADRIRAELPVGGAIEVDFFYAPVPIGRPNERKIMMRLALAADGESGVVYPPDVVPPGASEGTAMAETILNAITMVRRIPAEIRVRNSVNKARLTKLAKVLGSELRISPQLDRLDEAYDALLGHLAR
jgi:hypothetical protein